jgi:hypothetical protein
VPVKKRDDPRSRVLSGGGTAPTHLESYLSIEQEEIEESALKQWPKLLVYWRTREQRSREACCRALYDELGRVRRALEQLKRVRPPEESETSQRPPSAAKSTS